MQNQIAYAFNSAQEADRFLNRLKNSPEYDVHVKRYKGSKSILVAYELPQHNQFDTTCQQLDDLSAELGGHEISTTD